MLHDTIPDAVWQEWEQECQWLGGPYDLQTGVIRGGRTAVVCWWDRGMTRVMVYRPLAVALVERRAAFMLRPLLREAVRQHAATGRIAVADMPVWAERFVRTQTET